MMRFVPLRHVLRPAGSPRRVHASARPSGLKCTKYEYALPRSQARRFAKAMKAPLIFSSTSHSINVQKIFKIVLSKVFDLKCNLEPVSNVGEPILEY